MQNRPPFGRQTDLDWAAEYVAENVGPGRRIYAAVWPTKRQAHDACNQIVCPFFFPCLWPPLILCLPCICYSGIKERQTVASSLTIITDKEVILVGKKNCSPLCKEGVRITIPFHVISSVSVDKVGRGWEVVPLPSVKIQVTGGWGKSRKRLSNPGLFRYGHQDGYTIVPNPDRLVQLIVDLKEGRTPAMGPPDQVPVPIPRPTAPSLPSESHMYGRPFLSTPSAITMTGYGEGMPAMGIPCTPPLYVYEHAQPPSSSLSSAADKIRVFVTLSIDPEACSIVMVPKQGGIDGLQKLVCEKFNIGTNVPLSLKLAEVNALVTSVNDLREDDRLIAEVGTA